MAATKLALKVDVDTLVGLREGVPNLLDLFRKFGIQASFFVAFGPDNSGKAIRRVLKKGFLWKMWRTNALRTYGFKTLLYGTLLPSPLIGEGLPVLIREIAAEGHEVGIHGYDHVKWHDRLDALSIPEIEGEIQKSIAAYKEILGRKPLSSAAPGWRCNLKSLAVQDKYGFLYCSDTRGRRPFIPRIGKQIFRALQIPTTLPTMDEALGLGGVTAKNFNAHLLTQLVEDRLNIYTLHAEMEGMSRKGLFEDFLERSRKIGIEYVRLWDEAEALLRGERGIIPIDDIYQRPIMGRVGMVGYQG
ncbi:MAG: 4-deoxy-4-formamido-L-arabinose-phosphoundecaprenol deformylase [candidate division NC10 bacterium]|nr:4-deoxy-4-formamido-L-arabinose-phosphoundecaprenol deformylase [candidate division NC10 bacterium]